MKQKFVDRVSVTLSGGQGGRGAVHFQSSARSPRGGPDGGDGGDGGDLFLKTSERLWDLSSLQRPSFKAEDGQPGEGGRRKGAKGKNLVLSIPLHTCCYSQTGRLLYPSGPTEKPVSPLNLKKTSHEPVLLLKGGKGGKGNAFFRTARRQAPRTAQAGEKAQTKKVILEMKWPSHVALIGLKGVGKSRLIGLFHSYLADLVKEGARAEKKPKEDKPMSTTETEDQNHAQTSHFRLPGTEDQNHAQTSHFRLPKKPSSGPRLFVLQWPDSYMSLKVADLPGLNPTGQNFLQQAEKAQALLFVVSLESQNPLSSYQNLIKILLSYDEEQKTSLSKKPRLLLLKGPKNPDTEKKEKMFKEMKKLSFFTEDHPEDMKKLLSFLKPNWF